MARARLSLKEQHQVLRDLKIFLQYGYTVSQAIQYIHKSATNRNIRSMCHDCSFYLAKGYNLTEFFNRTNWIEKEFISIIDIGEQTARLYSQDNASALDLLIQNIERTLNFKKQLISAISYPLITLSIIIVIAFVLIVFILPKILGNMIKIAGDTAKLPPETLYTYKFVTFVNDHLIGTFIVFFGFIGFCIYFVFHREIILGWLGDNIFKLPVLSGFYKTLFYIKFFSSMFMFNTSGINLADTLSYIYKAEINPYLKNIIFRIKKKVEKGESLYMSSRGETVIFDPLILSAFEQAEMGGLGQRLTFLIEFYTEKLNTFVEIFKNIIQPAAIIIVAFIIGGMAILLIRSIYAFIQNMPKM